MLPVALVPPVPLAPFSLARLVLPGYSWIIMGSVTAFALLDIILSLIHLPALVYASSAIKAAVHVPGLETQIVVYAVLDISRIICSNVFQVVL